MKILSTLLLTLSTLLCANEGENLFNAKCRICHGNLADRPVYKASSIIAGWSIEKPYTLFKVINTLNTVDVLKVQWKA